MDSGTFVDGREAARTLFGDLIRRYRETVTPSKRGAFDEAIRLKALERRKLAKLAVANVTPAVIAAFRDERLAEVASSTVIRDLAVLSSIFNHAYREWSMTGTNPVALVRKPRNPPGRDRVLNAEEEARLLSYAAPQGRRNPILLPLVIVALETAMRRGELLALNWKDIDFERRIARLHITKNGRSRDVPLSSKAVDTLASLGSSLSGSVFSVRVAALDKMFGRLCVRAEVKGLRFHDLRHTATTRPAKKLPNVIELAAVTGHQSLQMLKRYYHPSAADLAIKIW